MKNSYKILPFEVRSVLITPTDILVLYTVPIWFDWVLLGVAWFCAVFSYQHFQSRSQNGWWMIFFSTIWTSSPRKYNEIINMLPWSIAECEDTADPLIYRHIAAFSCSFSFLAWLSVLSTCKRNKGESLSRVNVCSADNQDRGRACLCVRWEGRSSPASTGSRLRCIPHNNVLKKLQVHCSHHSSYCCSEWAPFSPPCTHCLFCAHTHAEQPERVTSWVLDFVVECEQIMSRAVVPLDAHDWQRAFFSSSALPAVVNFSLTSKTSTKHWHDYLSRLTVQQHSFRIQY